jgi:predicted tellurium resistance membrane protein TerC
VVYMFEWVTSPESWIALGTLIALEIVLGIDNVIFISILAGRLPPEQRNKGRQLGLVMAMLARLGLLFGISWIIGLVEPWFTVFSNEISGRDLILIAGGLFLLGKSTHEIHAKLTKNEITKEVSKNVSFFSVLVQITILDVVFSIDSVITAVGLVEHLSIMVIAIVLSVGVMLLTAKWVSLFLENNPTIKILALSFLLMIGLTLIVEGFDVHLPKGYIYFAMAFSIGVEFLNMKVRRRRDRKITKPDKKSTLS